MSQTRASRESKDGRKEGEKGGKVRKEGENVSGRSGIRKKQRCLMRRRTRRKTGQGGDSLEGGERGARSSKGEVWER